MVERRAFLFRPHRPLVSALNFLCLDHRENWKSVIAWNVICLCRNRPWSRQIWNGVMWRAALALVPRSFVFCTPGHLFTKNPVAFVGDVSSNFVGFFTSSLSEVWVPAHCDSPLEQASPRSARLNSCGRGKGAALLQWAVQLEGFQWHSWEQRWDLPDS